MTVNGKTPEEGGGDKKRTRRDKLSEGAPLDPIARLTRDLKTASITLTPHEARFLVDSYYEIQEYRKSSNNQIRALKESGEPHEVLIWMANNMEVFEGQILRALDAWTSGKALGLWSKSIVGIGPVISAGLLAHIDITQAPVVGNIWRFAGLDPTVEWMGKVRAKKFVDELMPLYRTDLSAALTAGCAKLGLREESLRRMATTTPAGKPRTLTVDGLVAAFAKRPWNASLKTLCWKIGESFVKTSTRDGDVYGHLYVKRKQEEGDRNMAGVYAQQAEQHLVRYNVGRSTEAWPWYAGCYQPGDYITYYMLDADDRQKKMRALAGAPGSGVRMLPPGHIHARAKRWVVKLFLAHYHHVAYRLHYKTEPPKPYALEHLGHAHMMPPPNFPTDSAQPGTSAA